MSDIGLVTGRVWDPVTAEVGTIRYVFLPDEKGYRRRRKAEDRAQGITTRYTTPYTLMFRPAFQLIALNRTIRSGDIRVLFLIADQIEPNQRDIALDTTVVAAQLDIQPVSVVNAVNRLVKVGLLIRPKRGRLAFNPEYLWCGGVKRREIAVHLQRNGQP